MAPVDHANGSANGDDFRRALDAPLGFSSGCGVQHPPSSSPVDEIERLRARVDDAVAHAAVLERQAEELKAGLRATVVVYQEQLADMEKEHQQRLATIRAGARAEIERISADARRRAADLDAGAPLPPMSAAPGAPAGRYGGSNSAA